MNQRLRFRVFARDNFKCVYCGRTPPDVILQTDHILPSSANGSDELDNLVTACFDCNTGKGDVLLTSKKFVAKLMNSWTPFDKRLNKLREKLRTMEIEGAPAHDIRPVLEEKMFCQIGQEKYNKEHRGA